MGLFMAEYNVRKAGMGSKSVPHRGEFPYPHTILTTAFQGESYCSKSFML